MSVRKEGGGYEFKMKMNGKLQGPFMGVFRKMFPAAKPAFGQGFLTGQFADEKTAVNAFAIGKKLMTSGPYKKGEAPQILDSKNDLPAEDIPEYEAVVKAAGEGEAVVVIKGKCANIVNAYKELCDYAGIAFDAEVFNRQLKLNGNDTYVTYDMVWFVDALTEKGVPPDPDAKLQELRKARFGVMLNSFIRNSCGAQAKAKAGDMLEAGRLKPED